MTVHAATTDVNSRMQWKDRGWWASVTFPHSASNKMERAMELAGKVKSYTMIRPNGQRFQRALFTGREAEKARVLLQLIETTRNWSETELHVLGDLVEGNSKKSFLRCLRCFAGGECPPCAHRDLKVRLSYVGCHLDRIGLARLSVGDCMKERRKWWFCFGTAERDGWVFRLDRDALRSAAIAGSRFRRCPGFEEGLFAVAIDCLPSTVDACRERGWLTAREAAQKYWYHLKCRRRENFRVPIVPGNERDYEKWFRAKVLKKVKAFL